MISDLELKAAFAKLRALKEEREGYKAEVKRLQKDIDSLLLALENRVLNPGKQAEMVMTGPVGVVGNGDGEEEEEAEEE